MRGLITNELTKIFSRKLTGAIVALVVVLTIAASVMGKRSSTTATDWRAKTTRLARQYEERLKITELSPELRADAQNKLQIATYRLENDVPTPPSNPWSAMLSLSGLVEMIILFTILIAAESVAGEYTAGTMKLLLIRPHSRTEILISKFIAVALFSVIQLAVLTVTAYAANALLYGVGDLHATDLFLNQQGEVVQRNIALHHLPARPEMTLGFSITVLLGYIAGFSLISWTVFQKRDVFL